MIGTIEYEGYTIEGFDPEEVIRCIEGEDSIGCAFVWEDTPQGFDFWNAEDDKNGDYSQEARDALIEMLYLWNEQNPNEAVDIPWKNPAPKLPVGQRVKVVDHRGSGCPEWVGLFGFIIECDDKPTEMPYLVKMDDGETGWFGLNDVVPATSEDTKTETLRNHITEILDAAALYGDVKSVTVSTEGVKVEFCE